MAWASMSRALSQRASQKPSRPASKATVMRLIGQPSGAAVVVGVGVIRVEADRLVEVGDGAIVIALGLPGVGAAVEGQGVVRIETYGCAVTIKMRGQRQSG